MNLAVRDLFDDAALQYDRHRQKVIPCFDELYGTLIRLIPFEQEEPFRFLDLGAGTGLVSALTFSRFPNARAVLVDISEKMLAQARKRFQDCRQVSFRVMDYAASPLEKDFDLALSAMSIHHLDHEEKQRLFDKIYDALNPGGWFLQADLALGASAYTERLYQSNWRHHLQTAGLTGEQLSAIYDRMALDRPARIHDQLGWLENAGFQDVDVYYKFYNFAVSGGRKALSGAE